MLPLWGTEERAIIQVLTGALHDKFSPDQVHRIRACVAARDLPEGVTIDLWHLLSQVEARRRTHIAIDQGLLYDGEDAAHWFGAIGRLHVDSLRISRDSTMVRLRICDTQPKAFSVDLPIAPDSIMLASSISCPDWHLRLVAGTTEDRMLLALVSTAVATDRRTMLQTHRVSDFVSRDELVALDKAVRGRMERILDGDSKR
jgi:hypothetical protein